MSMKIIALSLIMTFSSSTSANECSNKTVPVGAKVVITRDADASSNMYHVRLPKIIEGEELKLLTLIAQQNSDEKISELALPLAIKTKGNRTGSYFYVSENWLNIQITGNYGKELCTEISSIVDM